MPKITAIETAVPSGIMTNLLLLRVHTDEGIIGCGETYYTPTAIESLVHDWMAERLIGSEATDIEAHWRFLYERCTAFGFPGAELRALSAIDVALWDILGQVCEQPVWKLLGGQAQSKVRIYNTCGGPGYGTRKQRSAAQHPGWPGYGDEGQPGPLQDNWSSIHAAGDLAEELVSEGITGMKVWPFDRYAHKTGGAYLSRADIDAGMKPLREIRDRVGDQIEIMIEGHAFFQLASALRLAEALKEIRPMWLEDVLRVDNAQTLADFRRQSGMPVAASEMVLGRASALSILQSQAADYLMVDPTWSGGISETRRMIDLAQTFNVSATMHDCTGPLTLFSGLHCAVASTNVVLQETVRAHLKTFYESLIDRQPVVENGWLLPPSDPGLGTALLPELFESDQHSVRRTS
ncbi:MAG: mandelate racemase/muconate lactonizing enzyme family protein [Planctomycetaceae bacterium]|nr:mandelate racemase/muconate lactonizing enzyme family protein [Planctomycetaceae bacterium]